MIQGQRQIIFLCQGLFAYLFKLSDNAKVRQGAPNLGAEAPRKEEPK